MRRIKQISLIAAVVVCFSAGDVLARGGPRGGGQGGGGQRGMRGGSGGQTGMMQRQRLRNGSCAGQAGTMQGAMNQYRYGGSGFGYQTPMQQRWMQQQRLMQQQRWMQQQFLQQQLMRRQRLRDGSGAGQRGAVNAKRRN